MNGITNTTKMEIIRLFNDQPKKGIGRLKEVCRLNQLNPEEELAKLFLEKKKELNLDYVGDYLSGPYEEQKNALEHFTGKMNFQDKPFVSALRDFLRAFKLPGEAQKIDRLVEKFGKKYCQQNPNEHGIKDKDAVYILAFQTIMLNSDLHKEGVKKKMTLEKLKKNLRACNNKENFPDDLLEGIYNEIKRKPFELNFVKTPVGYVIHDDKLSNAKAYKEVEKLLSSGGYEENNLTNCLKDIFPSLKKDGDFEVKIDQPKASWLKKFTGYQGDIVVTDKESQESVKIQLYEPGVWARWFSGDKSKIIVQPIPAKNKEPTENAIKMAANITAGFKLAAVVGATYNYQKADLMHHYTSVVTGKDTDRSGKKIWANMVDKENIANKRSTSLAVSVR